MSNQVNLPQVDSNQGAEFFFFKDEQGNGRQPGLACETPRVATVFSFFNEFALNSVITLALCLRCEAPNQ